MGVMFTHEDSNRGPRYLSAAVLITAAVMVSNMLAATIITHTEPGRAIAQRDSASRWLHSLTDAARRLHGQNIAAIGRQLCTLPADELADRMRPAPVTSTISGQTHFNPQLIDLPPPAAATA